MAAWGRQIVTEPQDFSNGGLMIDSGLEFIVDIAQRLDLVASLSIKTDRTG